MAADVSPGILADVKKAFSERFEASAKVRKFSARIRAGTASFTDLNEYAAEVGKCLADAFQAVIKPGVLPDDRLYWNIAQSVVRPMLLQNVDYANDAAVAVQSIADKAVEIGLKPIRAPVPEDRIDGLLKYATTNGIGVDDVVTRLSECQNLTQSVIDDFIQTNAEARSKSGYAAVIIRTGGSGCCEWCQKLTGTYDYKNVSKKVFLRHSGCTCNVTYKSGKTYQDVYSKSKAKTLKESTAQQDAWMLKYDSAIQKKREENIAEYMEQKKWSRAKAADYVDANKLWR